MNKLSLRHHNLVTSAKALSAALLVPLLGCPSAQPPLMAADSSTGSEGTSSEGISSESNSGESGSSTSGESGSSPSSESGSSTGSDTGWGPSTGHSMPTSDQELCEKSCVVEIMCWSDPELDYTVDECIADCFTQLHNFDDYCDAIAREISTCLVSLSSCDTLSECLPLLDKLVDCDPAYATDTGTTGSDTGTTGSDTGTTGDEMGTTGDETGSAMPTN